MNGGAVVRPLLLQATGHGAVPKAPWVISFRIGLISLQFKGLSRVFSNTTVRKHQFFSAQPSLLSSSHIHT